MRNHIALPFAALLAVAPLSAQEVERQKPPAPGPLRPFTVPATSETRLPNGIRVVVVERRALPIVHARIIVNAGAVLEPAAKGGLASLTGALLIEGGASGMTSAQLAQRIDALGAQVASSAGFTSAGVNVTSGTAVFADAMALAAAAVRAPAFDEREFGRVKNQALAGYAQSMASAEGIADRIFPAAIYDSLAPYGRSPQGNAATLGSITRDDVVNWHRAMFSPANATILFVGDIEMSQATSLANRLFGDWTGPAHGMALPANAWRTTQRTRVVLVDRPGSVQSSIYIGVPGIPATDPEFFRMTVLNRLLGGGFTSRINTNLRERRGFTYGANTVLAALQNAGTFYASSSVRTSATDSALAEVMHEFRAIASEPVPAAELQAAVNNLVASFPASVQTVQELAGRMQTVVLYGMPMDYYATYRERLAAVTAEEIQTLARTRLNPAAITMVVVGDLSKIEAGIRARDFGDVEVWDREGKRLR